MENMFSFKLAPVRVVINYRNGLRIVPARIARVSVESNHVVLCYSAGFEEMAKPQSFNAAARSEKSYDIPLVVVPDDRYLQVHLPQRSDHTLRAGLVAEVDLDEETIIRFDERTRRQVYIIPPSLQLFARWRLSSSKRVTDARKALPECFFVEWIADKSHVVYPIWPGDAAYMLPQVAEVELDVLTDMNEEDQPLLQNNGEEVYAAVVGQ